MAPPTSGNYAIDENQCETQSIKNKIGRSDVQWRGISSFEDEAASF